MQSSCRKAEMNTFYFNKALLVFIVFSSFVGYLINTGIVAYGPILFLCFSIAVGYFFKPIKMAQSNWVAVLSFIPYVTLAGLYYLLAPLDGRYITTQSLVIISIPFIVFSIIRLSYCEVDFDYERFVCRLVVSFLCLQLVICIGQMSYYLYGIGFYVPEVYESYFFISGTFANPNDLAAIVVLISFIFTKVEERLSKTGSTLVWCSIFILLIITGSRSALVVTTSFFLINRGFNLKKLILYLALFFCIFFFYEFLITNASDGALGRVAARIDSIVSIANQGVSSDGSMSIRSDSYLYFITQLPTLGFGSGELNNYFIYSIDAQFDKNLMFQNPHSLIVEIGYWLGWPGLISFFSALFYIIIRYSESKFNLLVIVFISMFISSSVLGNLAYFCFLFISLFGVRK